MASISPAQPILPHRAAFGTRRPDDLAGLALPPQPMPSRRGLHALKAWRYVGVFGPEIMLCAAQIRIGAARQAFWALWDRRAGRLYERTLFRGRDEVSLLPGRMTIRGREVQIDLALQETAGIEAVCPSGSRYAWTRKQGGVPVDGVVMIDGDPRRVTARAIIDDTAAYYERHTSWCWSAGVGTGVGGQPVAWNLVSGVNDPPRSSERTIWVDGAEREPPPCHFEPDLSRVDGLRFTPEALRERRQNLLLVRSAYRQPFGTFSGTLPGGPELADGFGVMEAHDVWW